MNLALTALVAFVMIASGVAHLAMPEVFVPLVPAVFPAAATIAGTGILQLAIGGAALWPRTRAWAGLAFAALCAGYLPLHVWDYFRPDPVFAPPLAATLRVLAQLPLIAAGWHLFRRSAGNR